MQIRKVELADLDEINEIFQTVFINSVAIALTD
jgi:hypothetical protein